jgi:hypothetical protein
VSPSLSDFLEDAAGRSRGNEVRLTVRELLDYWGAKRRGYWIVDQIERDLALAGISTRPPFTDGWIDNLVTLIPSPANSTGEATATLPPSGDQGQKDLSLPDVSLTIGSLPSANLGVVSVGPQDALERAQSIMMRFDYSQLAVMSGPRSLSGAITWESIAQARIRDSRAPLKEATVVAETVRSGDDLLAQIPRIVDAGFVFVQAVNRQISGIVTTADLSNQFATLAQPFFLLAEVERRFRRIIDRSFDLYQIQAAADPSDPHRNVRSADDLTLGEYVRIFENPERWTQLGWTLDRVEFVQAFHQVRSIRNDVMHFSPDPLDEEQIRQLQLFLKWLRKLDPEL